MIDHFVLSDGTIEKYDYNALVNKPEISSIPFDLARIGRKIVFGTASTSSTYDSSGAACVMQGGCMVSDTVCAYALWDSLNKDLNLNKIVLMNINTGEILEEADYNYGWCNSLAYANDKIYVAVRGTTNSGTSTNNGTIKVLDASTLAEDSSFTLPINVNAISIHDDVLYALEESTTKIYAYSLSGSSLGSVINLGISVDGLYNQSIKVTEDSIYLLSTKPYYYLSVFDSYGTLRQIYNVPKYGGLYQVGEPQWVDVLSGTNLVIGSATTIYEEAINQFFQFDLTHNVPSQIFMSDNIEVLYCDSAKNYYNPDGKSGNEFTTMNEASLVKIDNIILNGNSKTYKYTHLSNHEHVKLRQAVFSEGIYIELGIYSSESCTYKHSVNSSALGCVYMRDADFISDRDTFDAESNANCIVCSRCSNLKTLKPTYTNNTGSAVLDAANTAIIDPASCIGGGYYTGASKTYTLNGASVYLAATHRIGSNNINASSGACVAIIATGSSASNTGRIDYLRTDDNITPFALSGLTLTVTPVSSYSLITLVKLS